MSGQYFSNNELLQLVGPVDFSEFQPTSKDSYSDKAIWTSIQATKQPKKLMFSAIQTAVVGQGNKMFGEFRYQSSVVDIKKLYNELGIKENLSQNAKLQPGDLTPRRLQRFFRAQINKFIEDQPLVMPYLWKKYSTMDPTYRSITFPGAECFITEKHQGIYLLKTYQALDVATGSTIIDRVKRILMARNVLTQKDILDAFA